MYLGIGLGITRLSGVLGFNPASLFANGEEGAWYDPSDSSTVWQDAAGTTPAGVGDPVGRIDDKSGNGNHATQSTPTARPTLQVSGGLYYLDFDGTDDLMATTFASAQAQPNTISAAIKFDQGSRNEYVADGIGSDRNGIYKPTDKLFIYAGSNVSDPSVAGTSEIVFTGHFNTTSSVLRVDGTQVATGDAGVLNWGGITLASNRIASNWMDGRIYGFIGVNRTLTAGEIDGVESYLAAKSGATL